MSSSQIIREIWHNSEIQLKLIWKGRMWEFGNLPKIFLQLQMDTLRNLQVLVKIQSIGDLIQNLKASLWLSHVKIEISKASKDYACTTRIFETYSKYKSNCLIIIYVKYIWKNCLYSRSSFICPKVVYDHRFNEVVNSSALKTMDQVMFSEVSIFHL